jgi:proton-dependent oligopeptide transporter, POT family
MPTTSTKHPYGLPFLFLAEMWERFGYYMMIGIFTLFLKDTIDNGGYGYAEKDASNLYGTFIAFTFLAPFVGGILADRVLGYRRSIVFGGILMGLGYSLMAIHNINMLYFAMGLVCLGNGFFKPNISTLLGNLYNTPEYKDKKDAGYNIFYMGINIGAFISNFIAAMMFNRYGWPAAFGMAGIGMFIGVIVFLIGTRHYRHADILKPATAEDMPLGQMFLKILLPAAIVGTLGYRYWAGVYNDKVDKFDPMTVGFLLACIPILFYYGNIWWRSPKQEKEPVSALLAIFFVSIAFWAVFKQNGAMMNTWAKNYTDRTIPASLEPTLTKYYLTDKVKGDSVEGSILFSHFRKTLPGTKDSFAVKGLTINPYLLNMPASERPKAGEVIRPFSSSISQSVNPFWVIALTPLLVAFFGYLRRRGKEPSTPDKIAWGLVISALSMFIMIAAVNASQNGEVKASFTWFVGMYGVLTIGELFLSPMGLSLVSKLAPGRLTAVMMGGWFLATAIGNKMAGVLSSLWDTYEDKRVPFFINIALLGISALIIFAMLPWLRRIFRQYS